MHKFLSLRWFSPSRLEYLSGEGDSREQEGEGRCYMALSALPEENSKRNWRTPGLKCIKLMAENWV